MYECVLLNRHFKDLNPILFGEEECKPGYSYGPHSREHTLIHFVSSGRGVLKCNGAEHIVNAGEAFIICADDVATYTADKDDPWSYAWIGFDGELSEHFRLLPPVVRFSTNWAIEITQLNRDWGTIEYLVASKLFLMHSEWFSGKKSKTDYVKTVKDYVNAKSAHAISVEDIAKQMNLDRRYLSRIFKKKTGKSIQEYIIWTRIQKAKKFLNHGYSVAEAARLCGYDDVCNFSKMFKKQTNISPGQWRTAGALTSND